MNASISPGSKLLMLNRSLIQELIITATWF